MENPTVRKITWSLARHGLAFAVAPFALQALGQSQPAADLSPSNCVAASSSVDGSLGVCMLYREHAQGGSLESEKIEIFRKGEDPIFITPGGLIRDWHFWNEPSQIAVAFYGPDKTVIHALYDTSTGTLVAKLDHNPVDAGELPDWAKDRLELDLESLPESAELDRERSLWVTKILQQAGKIHPGMLRKDLDANFKTEGGISTRSQRAYVSKSCGIIKIMVKFKIAKPSDDPFYEDPEDVIVAVSQPYLQWSIMD
jgi:hypothetical protein